MPRYVPDTPDPTSVAGSCAAIVIAMVRQSRDFDIFNQEHRNQVYTALNETFDHMATALAKARQAYDRDHYAD